MIARILIRTYKTARRVIVAVIGGTVILIGLLLIVLPGPAIVIIPIGLAILSLEFAWARRLPHRIWAMIKQDKKIAKKSF